MPLGKDATAGDYVKDFRKSKAPQFKGKSKEKRHQMAIAAYLDKRDSQKEAKLAGNNLKLFSQLNRNGAKPELDRNIPELSMRLKAKAKIARGLRGPSKKARPDWMRDTGKRAKEIAKRARGHTALAKRDDTKKQLAKRALGITTEGSYKVSIAGLPDMYMDDKTPGQLLQKLRKIVKQPSMITDVERTTKAKKRKAFRDKAQGREEIKSEYKYDYGSPESVRLMKKITPGENVKEGMRGSTDAPKGPESYEAQYKRRLVKTTDPEHKEKGYKYRIKGKKNSALTKKLYKSKPDQAEFNKQMKRIAGHEFG
jgi:hypothetical protein|tara:strand:+ start:75 stop:1007 length:933 start_codon:yes stop_codon:yes gene_type:complete